MISLPQTNYGLATLSPECSAGIERGKKGCTYVYHTGYHDCERFGYKINHLPPPPASDHALFLLAEAPKKLLDPIPSSSRKDRYGVK